MENFKKKTFNKKKKRLLQIVNYINSMDELKVKLMGIRKIIFFKDTKFIK